MPPKRRRQPVAAVEDPEPEPEPEPVASDDNASQHEDQTGDSFSVTDETEPGFRFFNTTFATFRVSPLYIGQQPITPAGLETLSQRLRDTLVGDVVRGVQVGLESDATLGRAGALNRVVWRECNMDAILPTLAEEARDESRDARGGKRPKHLLCLELEYENVTFSALILPSIDDGDRDDRSRRPPSWRSNHKNNVRRDEDDADDANDAFAHYPLLLTRLPAPLKVVLTDFLSSTFDCRISPLHLGTRTLIRSWEQWIQASDAATIPAKKDIALTLAFDLEPSDPPTPETPQPGPSPPGLKTLDITVPAPEIHRFLRAGKVLSTPKRPADSTQTRTQSHTQSHTQTQPLKRRRGAKDEEGWTWREPIPPPSQKQPQQKQPPNNPPTSPPPPPPLSFPQPFTEALARYLDHTLALNIFHPAVRVQRVMCDAFALSDGRMKVFAPPPSSSSSSPSSSPPSSSSSSSSAIDTFMRDLIRRAEGKPWSPGALRLAELANAA
ncbi:kinetochore complex Sim4 subunit Fta1-domain-containing protein [Xylaria sp. CBS 124048]|nr:kinetochore complex Sim4 subunit Fta1-domain-containing protein [Xylaria sp. CBS 124048]